MIDAVREHSALSKPVKVYIWVSCPVVPLLWRCRPLGDGVDLIVFLEDEARRTQRPLMDVSEDVAPSLFGPHPSHSRCV